MSAARFASLVIAGVIALPHPVHADAEGEYRKAAAAYEAGKHADAVRHADAGYLEKPMAKLMYVKAMATFKQGRVDEAWSLLQIIHPKDLPEPMREAFVRDYEQVEQAQKDGVTNRAKAQEAAKDCTSED